MKEKIFLAPPTPRQLDGIRKRLDNCLFIEHACALEGVPKKIIVEWIKMGRKGKPGFVEFTDMIDQTNAEVANGIMTAVMQGVRDGDVKLAQWVYSKRIEPYTSVFRKTEERIEVEAEEISAIEDSISESDVEAAEARALAALEQKETAH